jgi:hypothetical protein
MACRRAAVAPRRASVSELVEENVDGLLFEPGNPRDLADKLARLLLDPPLRARIGDAAHRRVRERFPASQTRRRLLEAYARVLPPATWNPIAEIAPPLVSGLTGTHLTTGSREVGDITIDTRPAMDDAFAGPPTAISAPPTGTFPADVEGAVPPDTEPWIVIHPDGRIGRVRRARTAPTGGEGDLTPSEGTEAPPPPNLGVAFVAGELEVGRAEPGELEFVAEGEMLGKSEKV